MFPFDPSPMVRLPAVIWPRSEPLRVKSPEAFPSPMEFPDLETSKVVPAVPLLIVPLKVMLAVVMDRALLPVLKASPEARVKDPVPLLSVSASNVVVPAEVKSSLMVMPLVALRVIAPAADIPTVAAVNVMAPASAVRVVPEARERPLAPDNVKAP